MWRIAQLSPHRAIYPSVQQCVGGKLGYLGAVCCETHVLAESGFLQHIHLALSPPPLHTPHPLPLSSLSVSLSIHILLLIINSDSLTSYLIFTCLT